MIIPADRLLTFVAAILPFLVYGALVPQAAALCSIPFVIVSGLAVIDAAAGLARRQELSVELPPIVRLIARKAGCIAVHIHNTRKTAMSVTLGIPLPRSFVSPTQLLSVSLPAGTVESVASWQCEPGERGEYALGRCWFAFASPMGFWTVRHNTPAQTEIHVYPSLHAERRRMAALFLNRSLFGMHRQRLIGHGREFEKLRDYIPGDGFEDIHWKATAKRGHPVTKLYQIERTQEVYAALDYSRLSSRIVSDGPVLDRYIASALVLAVAAERQHDRFGLITFGRRVTRFIRASSGRAHFDVCRNALHALHAEESTPDFDDVVATMRMRLRHRAFLVIFTDLSDPSLAESFLRHAEMLSRRFVVLVCNVLAPGMAPLFTTPDVAGTDDIYERLGGHMAWQSLQEVQKALTHKGISLSLVTEDRVSTEVISQYVRIKARQML